MAENKTSARTTTTPAAQGAASANAAAGPCGSTVSNTPGCMLDSTIGAQIKLSLTSTQSTVTIVKAEYPPGTAVTSTASSITFTVQAGPQDLQVSYAFGVPNDIGKLVENCKDQTVWDQNVNSSMAVAPYTVCTPGK
jgi:hypothetical protein